MAAGGGAAVGSLADHLGVPTGINSLVVSALPFRAYGLIYNEFYRDQDLQSAVTVSTASGSDTTTNVVMQQCGWEKDYFTSSRPWEQKGPSVSIPLVGNAPISGLAISNTAVYNQPSTGYVPMQGQSGAGNNWNQGDASVKWRGDNATKIPDVYADLSLASGVTVNQLRQALAIQRFERPVLVMGLGLLSICFLVSAFVLLMLAYSVQSI